MTSRTNFAQPGHATEGENRSRGSGFFKTKLGALYLKDGSVFKGHQPAWQNQPLAGEVVFNTGMTGYVESLTDPSYAGQILVFTYPLIGNYGVRPADGESEKVQASGAIFSEGVLNFSHSTAESSIFDWLRQHQVPLLSSVDTRALTKHLRSRGTMAGVISSRPIEPKAIRLPRRAKDTKAPFTHNPKVPTKIILVDCGAKDNILRSLTSRQLQVKQVPADFDYTNEDYDGVVISNGPGNPVNYKKTIAIAAKALRSKKPVFGICLGSQIMALATGAITYKLRFGHRGHNQPCIQAADQRCYITSQNHGYAIREESLPKDWRVNFHNLNDGSVEGIEHKSLPHFAVQFHPEACPGPTDTNWLFEKFCNSL